MSVVLQNVFVWLLFAFLMLVSNAYLPLNSIPLMLFVVLCFVDWQWVREKLIEYRWEGGLLAIALLIGIAFSELPGKSIKGCYDFLRGVILFFPVMYLVRNCSDRVVSILPWTVLIAVTYLWGVVLWSSKGRFLDFNMVRPVVSALVGHYNTYGTYAAVICIVAITGLFQSKKLSKLYGFLMFASFAAGFLLVVYSGSRGSLVALVATILWHLFIRFRRWRWWVVAAGVLSVFVFSVLIYGGQSGAMMSTWQRKGADWTSGRLAIYSDAFSATLQHVPFTGFGPNTFKYLEHGQVMKFNVFMPHSVYLESFYSLGLIGSVLLSAALVLLLLRIRKKNMAGFCGYLGISLMVFYLLRGLVDMKLFSVPFAGSLAAAFGFLLSRSDFASTEDQNQ